MPCSTALCARILYGQAAVAVGLAAIVVAKPGAIGLRRARLRCRETNHGNRAQQCPQPQWQMRPRCFVLGQCERAQRQPLRRARQRNDRNPSCGSNMRICMWPAGNDLLAITNERRWCQRVGLMEGLTGAFVMWAFQSGTQEPLLAHCLELVRCGLKFLS